MADAFGVAAGIVGVLGLAIQITQVVAGFGLDWKDAPADVEGFRRDFQQNGIDRYYDARGDKP